MCNARSLQKIENRTGPSAVPWYTPVEMGSAAERIYRLSTGSVGNCWEVGITGPAGNGQPDRLRTTVYRCCTVSAWPIVFGDLQHQTLLINHIGLLGRFVTHPLLIGCCPLSQPKRFPSNVNFYIHAECWRRVDDLQNSQWAVGEQFVQRFWRYLVQLRSVWTLRGPIDRPSLLWA